MTTGVAFSAALLAFTPVAMADTPPAAPCTDTALIVPIAVPNGAGGIPVPPWSIPACPGTPSDTEPLPGH
ncbi:hypothetical protein GCM10010411_88710 [Actinomadura fulvescens]|uniref:Uncharacterized protein n=2 Tax=Actinomadura fulvescens TaxID=46160 RepID=A0ABP6D4W2_9ACTN